ncbi:hypothetical protein GCM10027614_04800 [Micromonospora vulcania]
MQSRPVGRADVAADDEQRDGDDQGQAGPGCHSRSGVEPTRAVRQVLAGGGTDQPRRDRRRDRRPDRPRQRSSGLAVAEWK